MPKLEKLVWRNERRKVDDLLPYEKNPRKITDKQMEDLKESLSKFGLAEIPAIDTDGKIVAGHQRIKALQLLGRGQEIIDIRVPNRPLSKAEFKQYLLTSNRSGGSWNWEILASDFDIDTLLTAGFDSTDLTNIFDDNLEVTDDNFDEEKELENDNRAINVKRGLRTRCEMGLRPGVAPTGYLNSKNVDKRCHAIIDPERGPIIKQMFNKVANEKWSGRKVHQWLKFELNFKSKGNKNLALGNIYLILQNPFYYGVFEYPEKSGNWYTGKHEPLIPKELFEAVQTQLKRDHIVKSEMKEFAFTKLLNCGHCGSGISADEKYKQLKDGTTARYVYYGCSRARDLNCKGGYMREEDLIEQLVKIIDDLDINEIGMRHKFEEEVERLNKFQRNFMTSNKTEVVKELDLRGYAKYLLKEGSTIEKRELMACIKTKMVLTQKILTLQK